MNFNEVLQISCKTVSREEREYNYVVSNYRPLKQRKQYFRWYYIFQRGPVLSTIGDKISDVVSGVMPIFLQ